MVIDVFFLASGATVLGSSLIRLDPPLFGWDILFLFTVGAPLGQSHGG
jgi:hypothetical protein